MIDLLRGKWLVVATMATALTALPHSLPARASADPPIINASGLYLIELQSGRVLLEKTRPAGFPPPASPKS